MTVFGNIPHHTIARCDTLRVRPLLRAVLNLADCPRAKRSEKNERRILIARDPPNRSDGLPRKRRERITWSTESSPENDRNHREAGGVD